MARDTGVTAAAEVESLAGVQPALQPTEDILETADNTVDFDEQALADASIAGSHKAFEELYAHYYPKVRAYCLRKTSNPALAEDIAQEAFARAFERINEFGGPKHFGGWVGTIAANLITDHYRRKRNSEISLESKFEDPDRGPSYEIDPIRNIQRTDTSRLVQLALSKLDDRQREAIVMHEVKGMTCAAVGDALGITEVAAESLLARARRRLRKEVTAKAAPADLFGVGGLGLLPSLLRAWRRAKDSVSRRTTMVQAATAKAFEAVGAVPSVDLAKGLVVVMGTALAVEMASAATPPVKPAVPVATQAATVSQPAPIAADGDPSSVSPASGGRLPVDIDGFIDPESRSAGVSTSGDVRAPDVDGTTEGHSGLNWDTGLLVDENGQTSLRARIFVNDDAGESLVDTGHIAEEVDATP